MFQTVGHHAIDLYSQAMGLPLYRAAIKGGSREQGRDYQPTEGDEVEDLFLLLKKIKASRRGVHEMFIVAYFIWSGMI